MPMWNDLLLRINLADNGSYPSRPGPPCESPDIIPYGTEPIADWQTLFAGNYGSDVGRNVSVNQDNFIYARAKNLSGNSASGDFYAYWSPASILMWPKQWSGNVMQTNTGASHVAFPTTPPGGIAVASEALKWNPRQIGSNDHYCLIGRVSTESHPNPIPDVTRLPAFAQYIRDNPDVCWRNVTLIDANMPTTSFSVGYDQGDLPGLMIVQIAGSYLPVAGAGQTPAQVAFNCSTPGPQPMMLLNPTPITGATQSFGLNTYVQANFQAPVTISFWNHGNLPIDDNFNLSFQWFYVPSPTVPEERVLHENGYTDSCESVGIPASLAAKVREDMLARNLLAGPEPVRVVRVGGYSLRKGMLKT
jgi:hypothetical protein